MKNIGYIGGDALYSLVKAHPDYEYTLLVRNEERGKPVAAAYPNARLVYGSLDDVDVIEKEAAAADIVIRTLEPWVFIYLYFYFYFYRRE